MQHQDTGGGKQETATDYARQLVRIPSGAVEMEGMLALAPGASGLVLFAHGSGSGRLSPRNNFVAEFLQAAGIATLLIDLLTIEEDRRYQTRFDIELLTQRLADAADWLARQDLSARLPLGLFGASTGAAAAFRVAAMPGRDIAALVSRGGRPDLAGPDALHAVRAPSMLIVGGEDHGVIDLNHIAYKALHCEKRLAVVAGATHLFEEEGALDEVAMLAAEWFASHFEEQRRHPL